MADDAFEAREMHDGAPIVHRDKKVSRRMALAIGAPGLLVGAVAAFVAMTNGTSPKPLPPVALPIVTAALIAMGLAFLVMGVMFGVLRTVVTEAAVHVKYGLWGPTIPLAQIRSCRVVPYDWTEFGGWGLRIGRHGARAYVPSNGPCVEIVYDDGGASRRVLVGGENPAATVQAIEQARAAVAAPLTRVAVDDVEGAAEAEAEAEAEASATSARVNGG